MQLETTVRWVCAIALFGFAAFYLTVLLDWVSAKRDLTRHR